MRFARKVDPKLAQAIQADMDDIDKENIMPTSKIVPVTPQLAAEETPERRFIPCDCTGGPGKDNKPGTGLLDDFTICPKCKGSGIV